MTEQELLKPILPALADNFEAGRGWYTHIEPVSIEEYEPLREALAKWRAEDLIEPSDECGSKLFRLTKKGYRTWLALITALRKLPVGT